MTNPTDIVDYTTRPLGEVTDGGRIEICPACGFVGLAVRYNSMGGRHPARYVHRRPAYSADAPRVQQQQARDASRQSEADSCYVDPAPRADGLKHEEAAAIGAWAAQARHQLALLESAVAAGWYDRLEGHTVQERFAALRSLLAAELPGIERTTGVEGDYGR